LWTYFVALSLPYLSIKFIPLIVVLLMVEMNLTKRNEEGTAREEEERGKEDSCMKNAKVKRNVYY
jgi:hypothetical protein